MPIDMSAANTPKAPPRKTASSRGSRTSTPTPVNVKSEREMRIDGLMGFGQLAQGACIMANQYADAATIGQYAPRLIPEIVNLAESYDWLKKGIDVLIQAGPFAGLLTVAVPMVLQFGVNHRRFDPSRLPASSGIVAPEVLEAQMQAGIMRMQADAMREQQEAMREAEAAKREMDEMMGILNEPTQYMETVPQSANGSQPSI